MKKTAALVLGLAGGLVLSACSLGGSDGGSDPVVADRDAEGTLTVWLMDGSQPESVVDRVNARFAEAYPNVTVNVELQQRSGIREILTSTLNSANTPDVVEVDGTFTANLADAGLLANLTDEADSLGIEDMLQALRDSGELDGARYGVPYYGGVRVVVYNTDEFEQAGITQTPTSLEELSAAAASLQEENADVKGYSGFYFPGRYWEGALPFIWDAGGDIAVNDDGTWSGALDSAESQAGLQTLKDLVDNYSAAPKVGDAIGNVEAFKTGRVGMMIDSWWAPGFLDSPEGGMQGKVGAFPLPGTDSGSTAPAYLGGANLAIPEKSGNQGLALEWVKIMTGAEVQTQLAKEGGVIPNQEAAFVGHEGQPFLQVADAAATNARFTPVSPNWAQVEASAVLPEMLVKIFTGRATIEEATTQASNAIAEALNG